MSSKNELNHISSTCSNASELIKSDDFIKGVSIILEKVKIFNKHYILSLFIKLKKNETLNKEEKEDLNFFVLNNKVAILGQDLLSKLEKVSINQKNNNISNSRKISEFLNSIFEENGIKKIQKYIGEVINMTELTLNVDKGTKKINKDLEEKEVNKNFQTDEFYMIKKLKYELTGNKIKYEGEEYLELHRNGYSYFKSKNTLKILTMKKIGIVTKILDKTKIFDKECIKLTGTYKTKIYYDIHTYKPIRIDMNMCIGTVIGEISFLGKSYLKVINSIGTPIIIDKNFNCMKIEGFGRIGDIIEHLEIGGNFYTLFKKVWGHDGYALENPQVDLKNIFTRQEICKSLNYEINGLHYNENYDNNSNFYYKRIFDKVYFPAFNTKTQERELLSLKTLKKLKINGIGIISDIYDIDIFSVPLILVENSKGKYYFFNENDGKIALLQGEGLETEKIGGEYYFKTNTINQFEYYINKKTGELLSFGTNNFCFRIKDFNDDFYIVNFEFGNLIYVDKKTLTSLGEKLEGEKLEGEKFQIGEKCELEGEKFQIGEKCELGGEGLQILEKCEGEGEEFQKSIDGIGNNYRILSEVTEIGIDFYIIEDQYLQKYYIRKDTLKFFTIKGIGKISKINNEELFIGNNCYIKMTNYKGEKFYVKKDNLEVCNIEGFGNIADINDEELFIGNDYYIKMTNCTGENFYVKKDNLEVCNIEGFGNIIDIDDEELFIGNDCYIKMTNYAGEKFYVKKDNLEVFNIEGFCNIAKIEDVEVFIGKIEYIYIINNEGQRFYIKKDTGEKLDIKNFGVVIKLNINEISILGATFILVENIKGEKCYINTETLDILRNERKIFNHKIIGEEKELNNNFLIIKDKKLKKYYMNKQTFEVFKIDGIGIVSEIVGKINFFDKIYLQIKNEKGQLFYISKNELELLIIEGVGLISTIIGEEKIFETICIKVKNKEGKIYYIDKMTGKSININGENKIINIKGEIQIGKVLYSIIKDEGGEINYYKKGTKELLTIEGVGIINSLSGDKIYIGEKTLIKVKNNKGEKYYIDINSFELLTLSQIFTNNDLSDFADTCIIEITKSKNGYFIIKTINNEIIITNLNFEPILLNNSIVNEVIDNDFIIGGQKLFNAFNKNNKIGFINIKTFQESYLIIKSTGKKIIEYVETLENHKISVITEDDENIEIFPFEIKIV